MSDFEIICHGAFKAQRFEVVNPVEFGNLQRICKALGIIPRKIEKEFFKKTYCPVCETFIIDYVRHFRKEKVNKKVGRLRNEKAIQYLVYIGDNCREIINFGAPHGTKSNFNTVHGKKNKPYDMNDRRRYWDSTPVFQRELTAVG